MQFFPTAEGYFKQTAGSPLGLGDYVFNYKDHLGNVRLSYGLNANVLTIIEENNYYPFGLKHSGYNNTVGLGGNDEARKILYNSKEFQSELGLN